VFGSYCCDFVQLFKDKRSYDYKSVRRWTTQKKIGYSLADCDKVRALKLLQHKVAGGFLAIRLNDVRTVHFI
jgi:hypothetical protein